MELKYVGAKPSVSAKGITFDQTKPDRYTFLNAAVELLEALSFDTSGDKKLYLYNVSGKELNGSELVDMLSKHCANPQEAFDSVQEKTTALIERYTKQVEENDRLLVDERRAWLGNIEVMRDYYLQYITNESAYQCALNALVDKIHESHIEEVTFTIGRNYGLVLSHLVEVLRYYKPPYDALLSFEKKDGETVGKLDMHRPKPLNL